MEVKKSYLSMLVYSKEKLIENYITEKKLYNKDDFLYKFYEEKINETQIELDKIYLLNPKLC